jgi:hypothetical protein
MNKLQDFIDFCKKVQPQTQEDIQRFFEGVILFPYDNELLLQSFLYLNIVDYFPFCESLLLFERSPNGSNNTDQGKCDFVFLTSDNKIALIETKFIDTENSGATKRTRRSHHRKKVFDQVIGLKQKFSHEWEISPELIKCCVFTTEDLAYRDEATDINAKYIPIKGLKKWQQDLRNVLRTKTNISAQTLSQEVIHDVDAPDLDEVSKIWMKYYICDVCSHPEICANSQICYFELSDND